MILQRKSGIIDKNRNRVVQRVEVARIQSKTWQLISENFYRKCLGVEGATHSAAGRRETHVGNAIDAEGTMCSG